jgi:hypothetical protein
VNPIRFGRDAAASMRGISKTELRGAACPATEAIKRDEPEASDEQRLLLTVLAEQFGGEVVVSTLSGSLAQALGRDASGSDRWLRAMLAELEHCGSVTLDVIDEADVIVRLSPHGAALLYPPTGTVPLAWRSGR